MDYTKKLQYHYRPQKGWVNDPNGLVYFKGYYHVFYQHSPNYERTGYEPIHWGHARTKDFLTWEELPVALYPDQSYDANGCWSGTAIVKDGTLYLLYASLHEESKEQTVSVAWSEDGISFQKYEKNPVIDHYPPEGGPDFRDPAVCYWNGQYYCVMATGNPADQAGRLLLYKSENLLEWEYVGVMTEWENCKFTECPSFIPSQSEALLSVSVCPLDKRHYFSVMYGDFQDNQFRVKYAGEIDKGPDQYAGQVFRDHLGRNILIAWIPGWSYQGYVQWDIGCMSLPRELKLIDGKIYGYPIQEVQHLLKDEDPCVQRTEKGFVVERTNRDPVIFEGEIRDLKILRDEYIVEIFVNGGEEIYTVLL